LTQIELLVVIFCFLLMTSGLLLIYQLSLRYTQMAQTQSTLQQQAAIALLKFSREFSLSYDDPLTVRLNTALPSVTFISSEGYLGGVPFSYDTQGNLQWQKWVCYYVNSATQQLERGEIAANPGPIVYPFPPGLVMPGLGMFQALTGPPTGVVARNIESLSVARTGQAAYTVCVVTSLPGVDGRNPCKTEFDSEVVVLNNQ
jgi:hypothetical protein